MIKFYFSDPPLPILCFFLYKHNTVWPWLIAKVHYWDTCGCVAQTTFLIQLYKSRSPWWLLLLLKAAACFLSLRFKISTEQFCERVGPCIQRRQKTEKANKFFASTRDNNNSNGGWFDCISCRDCHVDIFG